MRAYSNDLRVRVMAEVDAGSSTSAVAERFRVSADWVYKLKRLRRNTGSFGPRQRRVARDTKLTASMPRLKLLVEKHPKATLEELRLMLGEPVGLSTVWRAIVRLRS